MMNFDFNSLLMGAIGTVITSTKAEVDAQIDKAVAAVIAAVHNSETKIDDVVVRDLVAPALERLAAGIRAGLSA